MKSSILLFILPKIAILLKLKETANRDYVIYKNYLLKLKAFSFKWYLTKFYLFFKICWKLS